MECFCADADGEVVSPWRGTGVATQEIHVVSEKLTFSKNTNFEDIDRLGLHLDPFGSLMRSSWRHLGVILEPAGSILVVVN